MLMRRIKQVLIVIGGLITAVLLTALAYPHVRRVVVVNESLSFQHRLRIPALLEPRIVDGERVFELRAQRGQTELLPGRQTHTAGFNGSYLGPTIRAHRGDHVRMLVTNALGESTTVHWHGMRLPAIMDGGPHQPIAPGSSWSPYWEVTNEAATLWYHPHLMRQTADQVYKGLAGLFIIDDDNSDALGLPNTYGVDDIPVIVQDRNFDQAGELVYRRDLAQEGFGELGDRILVNGTYAPFVDIPKTLVRFRLLNASNARRFNFGFSDGRVFQQIATDGGLLERPVERTRLLLAPGERAEIVVDLSRTEMPVTMISDAVPGTATMFDLLSRARIGQNDRYQVFKILQVRPRVGAAEPRVLPHRLNTIPKTDPRSATRTRVFQLTDRMSINRKRMDADRIDELVHAGDLEIWEIRDEEALFYHTFHIHGVQFQILDRNGNAVAAESGWKDTVSIDPFETVRVAVRFGDYRDPHAPYMFHCHILDHEDQGMMGQFLVQ